MKKLPVGIHTFSQIINDGYLYIDKTKEAYELINNYKYVFLARPRRFGKSLFLTTLKEIFEGNKELFKGLYIYDKYDFVKYPVIKITWQGDLRSEQAISALLEEILIDNEKSLGLETRKDLMPSLRFSRLIKQAYEKYGKPVVILMEKNIMKNTKTKVRRFIW